MIFLGIAQFSVSVARAETAELQLTVDGIAQARGFMMIALHNSEKTFKKGGAPLKGIRAPVTGTPQLTVSFTGLEPGLYAVRLFQDINDNGKLDTKKMGRPTEPYGFSNNASARFGPPKFDDAAFTIEAGKAAQTILLINTRDTD